jgi:hypothetical protein
LKTDLPNTKAQSGDTSQARSQRNGGRQWEEVNIRQLEKAGGKKKKKTTHELKVTA